jgi:hypothetical protein
MQGTQLTAADRRRIDQLRSVQIATHSLLQVQVNETLAEIERRKEQGIKPDKQWFQVSQEYGTPSVADWMGF